MNTQRSSVSPVAKHAGNMNLELLAGREGEWSFRQRSEHLTKHPAKLQVLKQSLCPVQFESVQDGIFPQGKAPKLSTPFRPELILCG